MSPDLNPLVCHAPQTSAEERDAVLEVIEAEMQAYLTRDYDSWSHCWCDGPDIQRINTHIGTGVSVVSGADVRSQMLRIMTANPEVRLPRGVRKENLVVAVNDTMAWVTYDQVGAQDCIPPEMIGRYRELKILHKVDGTWKIACLMESEYHSGNTRLPMVEVGERLKALNMNPSASERLINHPLIMVRNDLVRLKGTGAHKDLTEAVVWLASIRDRSTLCIGGEVASRAIAMGQDAAGLAHVCWCILRDGKLFITFDDPVRLARKLEVAAQVFRLSTAQERLIEEMLAGHDIATAAKKLDISRNTAKTHLRRVYDKTGVRSQPALARLLLNADQREL